MTRIDGKQVDALLEGPKMATQAPSPASAGPSKLQGDKLAGAVAEAAGTAPPAAHVLPPAAQAAPPLTIDEFGRVDLRIARIVAAEHVEGADKLLRLTLDIGEERPRTVFAGI